MTLEDLARRQAIAARLSALRSFVDAETTAILRAIRDLPELTGAKDFSIAVRLASGTVDCEREADAVALAGAQLREAMQAQHRGRVMKGVRKALGYYR